MKVILFMVRGTVGYAGQEVDVNLNVCLSEAQYTPPQQQTPPSRNGEHKKEPDE